MIARPPRALTPHRLSLREWLLSWWPNPNQAKTVVLDYAQLAEQHQDALADLARYCCMYDTTFCDDPVQMAINEGRRQAFMHVAEMAKLTEEDIVHLQERTEDNG